MQLYPKGIIKQDIKIEDQIEFDASKLVSVPTIFLIIDSKSGALQNRKNGIFSGKGFYLHNAFDWHIIQDNERQLVLVPTRK